MRTPEGTVTDQPLTPEEKARILKSMEAEVRKVAENGGLKDSAVIHCDGGPFFLLGPNGQRLANRLIEEAMGEQK